MKKVRIKKFKFGKVTKKMNEVRNEKYTIKNKN